MKKLLTNGLRTRSPPRSHDRIERLRIERERREQHVGGLGDRTSERMVEHEANGQFFEHLPKVGVESSVLASDLTATNEAPGRAPVSSHSRNVTAPATIVAM